MTKLNTTAEQREAFDTCVWELYYILGQRIKCSTERTPEIEAHMEAEDEAAQVEHMANHLSFLLPRAEMRAAYGLDDVALDRAFRAAFSALVARDEEALDQLTDREGAKGRLLSLSVNISPVKTAGRQDDRTSVVRGKEDDAEARPNFDDYFGVCPKCGRVDNFQRPSRPLGCLP
jgi:hypothetical protein